MIALAFTENGPWGFAPAVHGSVYIVLHWSTSVATQVSNCKVGATYLISWYQRSRPNHVYCPIDINVYTDNVLLYANPSVSPNSWKLESATWTASTTSPTLVFNTTNPLGCDAATFLDLIVVKEGTSRKLKTLIPNS